MTDQFVNEDSLISFTGQCKLQIYKSKYIFLGLHDVLIRSLPASLSASRTLIIEPVHRQRSSKTTSVSKSTNHVRTNSAVNSNYSPLPDATVISETIPRHYRSTILEKSSPISTLNATTQYLKAWQQRL